MKTIHDALSISAAERAEALGLWLAEQPDGDSGPRMLAEALAAMANEPYSAPDSNVDNAQTYFLEAEGINAVLDDAAEKCSDRDLQAQLWTHAAWAAMLTGQLADLPYCYAKRAVRADPSSADAWSAFAESIRSETTDFFRDVEMFAREVEAGQLPADLPARALVAARSVCEYWDEADLERLADLEAQMMKSS